MHLGGSPGGVQEGFLPGGGSAELNLKEKLEMSQGEEEREEHSRWMVTYQSKDARVCDPVEEPKLTQHEALRVKWEVVRDEAKEISKGQVARGPGKRC